MKVEEGRGVFLGLFLMETSLQAAPVTSNTLEVLMLSIILET